MGYGDHWVLQELDRYTANPENHNSRDALVTRFSRCGAQERDNLLRTSQYYAFGQDGSTLRQRSQMLSLNRELEHMHRALLAAGR